MAIWPFFDDMAILSYRQKWSYGINMGIVGNSYKNAATWSRNRVDSTFLQEMRAIMVRWQIFLCIFSENPMYMPKMVATAQKCSKTHEIFFGGSWGIKAATCTSTEVNEHLGPFWDTLVVSHCLEALQIFLTRIQAFPSYPVIKTLWMTLNRWERFSLNPSGAVVSVLSWVLVTSRILVWKKI